ncbi:MAG: DNA polymerase III subunit epsilon [Pseudomonadota bacterium]|nr:DNA polymerase III subunit epsilon [Pseudomonadota bacterium]
MREVILDTETTGLNPASGDRLVEIGAVELIHRMPTGKVFHVYLNPERDMPKEAEAVHGLSATFLADKPFFAAKVEEFLEFIGDSKLVIHNASFDMGFINAELGYCGKLAIPADQVIDTLAMARRSHPAGPNSLDALCRRFGIDNSKRTKHGALLDAELLAEVYLEMMGGRQTNLGLAEVKKPVVQLQTDSRPIILLRPSPLPPRLTEQEKAAHHAALKDLGEAALWMK